MKNLIIYFNKVGIHIVFLLVFFLFDLYDFGYLAGYLLTGLIYIKKDFLLKNIDFGFTTIFLFSIVYAIFSIFHDDIFPQTILFYGLFPPVFYLLGKYFTSKLNKIEHLYLLFFIVGFLYSASALISVLINLKEGGFVQYDRSIAMFWGGNTRTATLMGAFFTFNMCIPALLLVQQLKFKLIYKLIALLIFISSLLCVFRLGSRTQVVIFLLMLLITLIFIVGKQSLNQNIRLILILILVIAITYLYVPMDLNSEYLSTLGQRLQESDNTGSAGGRTDRWMKSISNLFVKPLGWNVNEFGYSHNLWLDVARINGIIPFILLLTFSLRTWIVTKRAVSLNRKELPFNSLIITYTIAANLLFFVEPITEGIFSIFLVYCFFQGGINKYVFIIKNKIWKTETTQ